MQCTFGHCWEREEGDPRVHVVSFHLIQNIAPTVTAVLPRLYSETEVWHCKPAISDERACIARGHQKTLAACALLLLTAPTCLMSHLSGTAVTDLPVSSHRGMFCNWEVCKSGYTFTIVGHSLACALKAPCPPPHSALPLIGQQHHSTRYVLRVYPTLRCSPFNFLERILDR